MLLPLIAFFQIQQASTTYNGRANQVHVRIPRYEEEVVVDGNLDEPVWRRAALLNGFSQFAPQDGIPAQDSTEVLVWYSSTAIYFGIRAFEQHGPPHATLADRDHIDADDQVQILLGTYNDGRQATVFGVNPLGVQMDGTIVEQYQQASGGFLVILPAHQQADLSQDFVFQSKGHVTPFGYQVEVRIPFKSVRYQPTEKQSWGLNVVRIVQHSGFEDSWVPARRAAASFLRQSGTLDDLTGLHGGLVLDITPVVTQHTLGSPTYPAQPDQAWRYTAQAPAFGGDVRWGVTNNLTLDATIKPDFAEVESDATQILIDPRSAIQYPEKRPFFLENLSLFTTPNNLVYTRDMLLPEVATKLTGKVSGTTVAFLSAVDDRTASFAYNPLTGAGNNPVYNILRLQDDLGGDSHIGALYTDKVDGGYSNRMADVDGSLVFNRLYSVNFQGAASRTTSQDTAVTAPFWNASFNRNGKQVQMRYAISGLDPNFIPGAGFLGRRNVSHATVDEHFTWFGERGALINSVTFNPMYDDLWNYQALFHQADALEKKLHFSLETQLRGGWSAGFGLYLESFGYDSTLFTNTFVQRTRGTVIDTIPFTANGGVRLFNHDWLGSVTTPQWSKFNFSALAIVGPDEDFDEWATSNIVYLSLSSLIRPDDKLRITPTLSYQSYARPSTGDVMKIVRLIRVKTEYQVTRSIFVRLVNEFDAYDELPLRDESRTFGPLLYYNPATGTYAMSQGYRRRALATQLLFSYRPTPGTVFFAGYNVNAAPDALQLEQITETRYRTSDGFFVKFSYLFRM